MKKKVTVIGGGAAGISAAYFAALGGAEVTLIERNEKLGKKIYITGKGRCNVTNTAEDPIRYVVHNSSFLYSAFAAFTQRDLRDLLEHFGCPTKEERGGRVFPVSDKASDVTKAWITALHEVGVAVILDTRVNEIDSFLAKGSVILATGGKSYPSTGSTGDGYMLAKRYGHHIIEPRASLVPLETKESWPKHFQGLSLKNVRLIAKRGKKVIFNELGELLFTHFGISGPLSLSLSAEITDLDLSDVGVYLDLKPALTVEVLLARIDREIAQGSKKSLTTLLKTLLPCRMAELFPEMIGCDRNKIGNQLSRNDRRIVAEGLKSLPITISALRPIEEAVITRGGVDVREVNSATMESKLKKGLFFAGELLDVDARTGGFNLQIAFSTGAAAGRNSAG